jgi:hypothetical protein
MIISTGRVHTVTRQAISLHWRNMAEGETGMTEICATSSTTEMLTARLKIGVRSMSVPIMNNLTDSVLPKGGVM